MNIIIERFDTAGGLIYRAQTKDDPMQFAGCLHCKGGGQEFHVFSRGARWRLGSYLPCCVCGGWGYFRTDARVPDACE